MLIETHRDVTLYPLAPGSSKLRFVVPHAPGPFTIHHIRDNGRGPVDTVARLDAKLLDKPPPTYPGAMYGGILFNHFGHFLTESVHRLWPLLDQERDRAIPVVFHAYLSGHKGKQVALDDYMTDVFAMFGLERDDILVLTEPIVFEQLLVPEQAHWWGRPSPDLDYLASLGRLNKTSAPTNASNKLYISRRNYLHSGSYFGEALVEEHLARSGFTVLYPENLPPSELIRQFKAASKIVFSEGSAIHLIDLCGALAAEIYVICRRNQRFTELAFGATLSANAANIRYYGKAKPLGSFHWKQSSNGGGPLMSYASSFIDLRDLLADIADFGAVTVSLPTSTAVTSAIKSDMLRFILDPRNGARTSDENLGRLLRNIRDTASELSDFWTDQKLNISKTA